MKKVALTLCLLGPLAAGCHSVSLRQPLGDDDPHPYKTLEGSWTSDDGTVLTAHLSKRGQLFVSDLGWDDATEKFIATTFNVRATKAGKLQLLQSNFDPKLTDGRFGFGRYEIDDRKTVRIYWPNGSVFEDAVNSGKLKGTVVKQQFNTEVRLDEPSAAVLAFITKTGVDACFEKEPFTLKLLHRPD